MRFNGLDLNLLVALDALLSEMSVGRAAERVYLSQSAMSSALGRLRDYFEDELVVQVGRRLVMTPLAETLVEPVRDVLLRVDTTIATRQQFDPSQSRRSFCILLSDYSEAVLMAPLLAQASHDAPGVTFRLVPTISNPAEMLERGDADLLIIPERWSSRAHPMTLLIEETYTCLVWEGNEQVGEVLTYDDYLRLGHVVVQAGSSYLEGPSTAFDGLFLRDIGIERRVEVTTPHLTMPPRLLVGTQRMATVHSRIARQHVHMPLRLLPPPLDIPPLKLVMQWHKYRNHDPSLTWLRDMLLGIAATL